MPSTFPGEITLRHERRTKREFVICLTVADFALPYHCKVNNWAIRCFCLLKGCWLDDWTRLRSALYTTVASLCCVITRRPKSQSKENKWVPGLRSVELANWIDGRLVSEWNYFSNHLGYYIQLLWFLYVSGLKYYRIVVYFTDHGRCNPKFSTKFLQIQNWRFNEIQDCPNFSTKFSIWFQLYFTYTCMYRLCRTDRHGIRFGQRIKRESISQQ